MGRETLPKISIIVPVYKVERFLSKCIDSIIAQTFTDFELILVNDGSPDNSGAICDEYSRRDNRIKVIHKENGGLSSARNAGLKVARGNYIGFVDSDDYIHKKMYELLYSAAAIHSSDIILCDFLKVKIDYLENQKNIDLECLKIRHFTNLEALNQLQKNFSNKNETFGIQRNNIKWIIACNKLYKRSLFEQVNFIESRIFEDEFIMHKVIYNSKKITYIPRKLYYYVQRSDSILNAPFSIKKLDKVYAIKERADFFREIKQSELYYQAIVEYYNAFTWYYIKAMSEFPSNTEVKNLKITLIKSSLQILKNPKLIWKQKVIMLLFIINPTIIKFIKNI
jgi:glycosyltransferase involved in cell wall biosynthesis